MTAPTKRCSRCRQAQPLDAFSRHPTTADGRQPVCRLCRRERYLAEREYAIALKRQWVERNRDRVRTWEREYRPGYRERNAERVKMQARATAAVAYALKTGRLERPDACEACGADGPVEAHHHRGYGREHRLDVRWLCAVHHGAEHRVLEQVA